MLKIEERKLKTERSIVIANKLLEVFNYCIYRTGIICTSYSCCDESINREEEQVLCREIYISDRVTNTIKVKKSKKEDKNDLIEKHNTYYIHYKTHDYEIKFYDNPKIIHGDRDPMSYDVIEEYNEETDMFCTIRSLNSKGAIVYRMDFTFNIENMRFLYLYDLYSQHLKIEENKIVLNENTREFEVSAILILKKCYYTKTLVIELQNKVLGDVFKLDDTIL